MTQEQLSTAPLNELLAKWSPSQQQKGGNYESRGPLCRTRQHCGRVNFQHPLAHEFLTQMCWFSMQRFYLLKKAQMPTDISSNPQI